MDQNFGLEFLIFVGHEHKGICFCVPHLFAQHLDAAIHWSNILGLKESELQLVKLRIELGRHHYLCFAFCAVVFLNLNLLITRTNHRNAYLEIPCDFVIFAAVGVAEGYPLMEHHVVLLKVNVAQIKPKRPYTIVSEYSLVLHCN